jgi:hypothetical protein
MLAAGLMIPAVAFSVLVGRWITGDESSAGLLLRAALVIALGVIALTHFGTIWYFLLSAIALFPVAEISIGEGLASGWLGRQRHRRLGEAIMTAADGPASAISRLHLARGLLETRQTEAGLAALDAAVSLADEQSRALLEEMADDARREFVRWCPFCRRPNPASSRVCRSCLRPLSDDALTKAAVFLSRPALRLLLRSR